MPSRPSVQIYQDFTARPSTPLPPMNGVLIGPRHDVMRYSDEAFAGPYDKDIENEYSYPNRRAIATIKEDTVDVILNDGELKYFEKASGSGAYEFRAVKQAKNRLTTVSATQAGRLSFRESTMSGSILPRASAFYNRDVRNGDVVHVSATVGTDLKTTKAEVTGVISEKIPASIGAVSADASNQAPVSHSVALVGGAVSNGDTLSEAGTYAGDLADGVVTDLYTITVTSQGGDPEIDVPVKVVSSNDVTATASGAFNSEYYDKYTIEVVTEGGAGVAKVKVSSLLGDDVAEVTFTDFATDIVLTTKGVEINFIANAETELALGDKWTIEAHPSQAKLSIYSDSKTDDTPVKTFPGFDFVFEIGRGITIEIEDTDSNDILQLGSEWTVRGTMVFEATTATSSGDFVGTKPLSYFAEVIQGGVWGIAQVMFTSSGLDSSGPFIVNHSTELPVGSHGARIEFANNTQGGLLKGDKYIFNTIPEMDGAIKTLVLSKNIHNDILTDVPTVGSLVAGLSNTGTATLAGIYRDLKSVLSKVVSEVYTVTVTQTYVASPAAGLYTVTSASGLDDMTATAITLGTPLAIGSLGLTIEFGGIPTLNDTWTVQVDGIDLSVDISLKRNQFSIPKYRENIGFERAWVAGIGIVTVDDALMLSDPDWRSGLVHLPVMAGNIYITYQAVVGGITNSIQNISSLQDVVAELGEVSPENPLAYAVDKFLRNGIGNTICYYYPVPTDDVEGHTRFLSLAANSSIPYHMVPLTFDSAIHDLYIAQCDELSTPEFHKWRRVYICRERADNKQIMTDHSGNDYTATIIDYIDTPETDHIYVEVESPTTVNLITIGVRAGDILRTNYLTNNQGVLEYSDYVIAGVLSETTLLLETGPSVPNETAKKFTIHRVLNSSEMIDELVQVSSQIANRRVQLLLPDWITDNDDDIVPGYFVAAACVGFASSQPPHQGLTNYQLVGFKDSPRTYMEFSLTQLDTLADAGYWIITQDTSTSVPRVRHQLTTDVSTVEYQEMSIGTNVDNIAYYYHSILQEFIGVYNINQKTLGLIRGSLEAASEGLKSVDYPTAGPQLIDSVIDKLYQDPILKDHVRVEVVLTIPYPLNVLVVRLVI